MCNVLHSNEEHGKHEEEREEEQEEQEEHEEHEEHGVYARPKSRREAAGSKDEMERFLAACEVK